jgi:localization factor PodJL
MYQHGDGTPPDSVEALRWYEAAAGQGNCRAMHALGVAYAEGEGTDKDLVQAAHWFQRAADLGYVNSQFNLAVLYERGDGVPQSLREAYKWYSIAAAQGDRESRTRVEALKLQIPQTDLQGAQIAAQEFHPASADREANIVPAMADLASSALVSR